MPFTSDQLRAQYERALERNAARLAVLDALPEEDPYEDGQVLRISRTFGLSKVYTYAAVKADDRWWVTGERYLRYGTDKPSGVVGPAIEWHRLRSWLVESGDPQALSVTEMTPGRSLV